MEADVPIHRGDFALTTENYSEPFVDGIAARAKAYWVDVPRGLPEVVVGGPVTLTHRVE